jgi:bifunctional non-homologous end joining protein LigD
MSKVPFRVSPMLATLVDTPFARPNWIFEEKYDGVRMLAYKEGTRVTLISRNAIDRTARYPEIAAAIQKLKSKALCIDGEVVVFDAKDISRFQLLQQGKGRPQYAVFDCLYTEDKGDLRKKALSLRRTALEQIVKPSARLRLSAILSDDGLKAFQIASKRGFEGVVCKNLASIYVQKRSKEWLKVKVHQEDEFVIGGFTQPTGSRQYFGALLLGVYSRNKLLYAGKVGTGFDTEMLASLHRKFQPLVRSKSPFASVVRERDATFLAPKLVAQLSFTEWTKDGKLRHPVYLGLRDDKKPTEVTRKEA